MRDIIGITPLVLIYLVYCVPLQDAFALECEALAHVRNAMGLKNVELMVPFCRTPEEGKEVINILNANGLEKGKDGLKVWVMCELPSNVFGIDEFAKVFDGFSVSFVPSYY